MYMNEHRLPMEMTKVHLSIQTIVHSEPLRRMVEQKNKHIFNFDPPTRRCVISAYASLQLSRLVSWNERPSNFCADSASARIFISDSTSVE